MFSLIPWLMPRYRQPVWLDVIINNFLNSVTGYLTRLLRDTPLEYWLLDSQGQFGTLFVSVILVALIWLISLEYSAQAENPVASSVSTEATHDNVHGPGEIQEQPAPVTLPSDDIARTPSPVRASIMRSFARPDHRPTNAHLEISPFRTARPLGDPDRTGRITTPGYQTPFGKPTHSQDFSSLAEKAPVSYKTLKENGMLHPDGTPTKKWTVSRRMTDSRGIRGEDSRKEVVAWWVNDSGRRGGRARLRQDLDEEEDGVAARL
ncbi:uncharacterized protein K460DRAFT_405186 [Cucurbitaria berberidis CBS 394.84]|uniref:Uncharacterized protein n=1 Tax=Cucurbitaria berberidis CBS 394.84 TaxID=1168544 RepID=A0A9P4GF54_9PLEO|nr:uncharacterized protein K460DRAFT_405186 [Cucurbitaria berberidis CBS 394.84]KAF1844908.1 hypothetical protein K460DRAFT_405186 [Cucurbitaria berberidis CBS 394.84]